MLLEVTKHVLLPASCFLNHLHLGLLGEFILQQCLRIESCVNLWVEFSLQLRILITSFDHIDRFLIDARSLFKALNLWVV